MCCSSRKHRHVSCHCWVFCNILYCCSIGYDVYWFQGEIGNCVVLDIQSQPETTFMEMDKGLAFKTRRTNPKIQKTTYHILCQNGRGISTPLATVNKRFQS